VGARAPGMSPGMDLATPEGLCAPLTQHKPEVSPGLGKVCAKGARCILLKCGTRVSVHDPEKVNGQLEKATEIAFLAWGGQGLRQSERRRAVFYGPSLRSPVFCPVKQLGTHPLQDCSGV
jgi:hypothetical protein